MLRSARDPRLHALLLALLAAYVVTLALIAFWPTHVDRDAGPLLDAIERIFPWATYRRVEFAANVALFAPFGLLATLLLRSPVLALSVGIAASFAIEFVQEVALPGRTASALDLLANALGTAAGIGIALLIARVTASRRRPASA
ncbi:MULTISPECIES: VanZ family protein [Microbacterium]|uniref:VanZ family protein n=1 Tax=Microbacterium wangchenii TaxID=2541726 RepID=A0ABX5SRG5_9MICO|nr:MULTISPECIES: VanZ family protein [Microbacterium]MCK6068090.1 VanZ family protein [Microbacterium sp. EYE_512]QBR87786.1 VanZ family protein [Microbacterium wangchenii]